LSGIALQVTPEQMNQAKRLMASTSLESVRLIHVRAGIKIPECPVKDVDEKPMPTAVANLIPGTNRFQVIFGHAMHSQRGPEATTEVQVDASFELVYSFPQDMDPPPSPDELQAFADTNAIMNCWPYWRELVQTTVAKMNLPPLLVPLVRWVSPKPKPAESKQTDAQPTKVVAEPKAVGAPTKANA
jgi:hypothetical protein